MRMLNNAIESFSFLIIAGFSFKRVRDSNYYSSLLYYKDNYGFRIVIESVDYFQDNDETINVYFQNGDISKDSLSFYRAKDIREVEIIDKNATEQLKVNTRTCKNNPIQVLEMYADYIKNHFLDWLVK